MYKHISQTILLLTALLMILGNAVGFGVCPCHAGLFIGDCQCNLNLCAESRASACGCGSCQDTNTTADTSGHQGHPVADSGHCSGHCDNLTSGTEEPCLAASQLKTPDGDNSPEPDAVAPHPAPGILSGLACRHSDRKLRPPPDLVRDARLTYRGYMRPALA